MLRQLLAAIKPSLSLNQILHQWNQLRDDLSEPRRKRKMQLRFLS
jgi:hypothetical protein